MADASLAYNLKIITDDGFDLLVIVAIKRQPDDVGALG